MSVGRTGHLWRLLPHSRTLDHLPNKPPALRGALGKTRNVLEELKEAKARYEEISDRFWKIKHSVQAHVAL